MSAARQLPITPEEYLARERLAETKSEYYDGKIFAMAGGSEERSLIAMNVGIELGLQLRDRPCKAYNSDLRVLVDEEGPYVYPDLSIVCGAAKFADAEVDTLLNPTVIVEVLSPTTEAWDRGGKFEQYRQRESLQEYVLIAQDRPHVERFSRQADGQWLMSERNGLDATLPLPSIGCELAPSEVYRKVTFSEAPPPPSLPQRG